MARGPVGSGRPRTSRRQGINVVALRRFDPAVDQDSLEIRTGSSLRAQRSNLVDDAPGRLEIAASPCGHLAMTHFHLIPRDSETGRYRANAPLPAFAGMTTRSGNSLRIS